MWTCELWGDVYQCLVPVTDGVSLRVLSSGACPLPPAGRSEVLEAAQLKAAAALANLSTDRVGQEAMVTEHELVIPGLFKMLQVTS